MSAIAAPSAPPVSAWAMYRSLLGVGLACGLLIVAVYQATRPVIRANRIAARQRAILRVLPEAASTETFAPGDDGRFVPAAAGAGGSLVFAGYDEAGKLVGIAVEAQGMGYQDTIRVLWGYSPAQQAIVGMQVLESRETPGLGDRIETDPEFRANFEALDVALAPSGERLEHAIEMVKQGEKTAPWQIDAITGATISSRAIADMLRASTERWVPLIAGRLEDFEREARG